MDFSLGIAVTSDENCYVTGWTYSDDYPVVNEYDDTLSGGQDAFITIIGETTTSPFTELTEVSIAFGFIVFILGMPIVAVIVRKRRIA